MSKILMRRDLYRSPSAHEIQDNDLKSYALYLRVDDTVLRVNYMNLTKGTIRFDSITSTEIVPNEILLNNTLGSIIDDAKYKKDNPDEKQHYRVIWGY